MAGKKMTQVKGENQGENVIKRIPQGTNLQWVVSSLDSDDKGWLKDNSNHALEYVGEFLEELTFEFTLSVKREDKSGRYLATLVCTAAEHPGAGCAMSSRGSTAFNSIFALAYLAEVKYTGEWWSRAGGGDDDPWG